MSLQLEVLFYLDLWVKSDRLLGPVEVLLAHSAFSRASMGIPKGTIGRSVAVPFKTLQRSHRSPRKGPAGGSKSSHLSRRACSM